MVVHWQDEPPEPPEGETGFLPLDPEREGWRRSFYLTLLGMVLLAGFFLPMLVPAADREGGITTRLVYVNLAAITEEDMPGLLRLELAWPLIAGVITVILAWSVKGRLRGFLLILLPVVPVLVLLVDETVRKLVGVLRDVPDMPYVLLFHLLPVAGAAVMFAGSRTRRYRPGMRAAYLVGLLGAGMFVGSLFMPVPGRGDALAPYGRTATQREQDDGIRVVSPRHTASGKRFFRMKGEPGKSKKTDRVLRVIAVVEAATAEEKTPVRFTARVALAQMGFMSLAAFFCMVNLPGRGTKWRYCLGWTALLLLVVGLLVGLCPVIYQQTRGFLEAAQQAAPELQAAMRKALALQYLKVGAWIGGLLLLLPVGLTDMILGRPPERPAETPAYLPPPPPPPPQQTWFGGST